MSRDMNRKCDKCDICCIEPFIEELNKPSHTVCSNLDQSKDCHKCTIYNTRPKACQTYFCSWMDGYGNDLDRPNENGIIMSQHTFNNGTWLTARELISDALITTGRNMVIDMVNKIDLPVIVSLFESKIKTGDLTIIKESLKHRAKTMMGEFKGWFDNEKTMGIYVLTMPTRICGECRACCIQPKIEPLNKPMNTPCQHLKSGNGCESCTIHENRPKICMDYNCEWIKGLGKENDRPDKIGLMIDKNLGYFAAKPVWQDSEITKKTKNFIKRIENEKKTIITVLNYDGTFKKIDAKQINIRKRGRNGSYI